jgi:hypothetical protein
MKFIPIEYEILKGVTSTMKTPAIAQPSDQPSHVITLLGDEKRQAVRNWGSNSNCMERSIKHGDGCFFEDQGHDWLMRAGKFYYGSHAIASEVQAANDGQEAPTVDVMVVYKWLERKMSIDGIEDGESVLHSICRGHAMTITITNKSNKIGGRPEFVATFHSPSLNTSLEVADALSRAQATLVIYAQQEIARRESEWQLPASEKRSLIQVG